MVLKRELKTVLVLLSHLPPDYVVIALCLNVFLRLVLK